MNAYHPRVQVTSAPRIVKVGVVIVNYFSTDLIINCVRSIADAKARCGYPISIEVCVVDNSDSAEEFQKLETSVGLLGEGKITIAVLSGGGNHGFSRGTNAGILHVLSETDFVHILNPDTVLEQEFYNVLEKSWSGDRALSPVGTHLDNPAKYWSVGGRFYWMRARADVMQPKEIPSREPYTTAFGTCANLIVPKNIIRQIGFLDEDFFLGGEEWDYSRRIWKAGYPINVVPAAIYGHKISGTHRKRGKMFLYIGLRTKLLYVSKWYGLTKIAWTLPFLVYVLFQYPRVFKRNVGSLDIGSAVRILMLAVSDHFRYKRISLSHIERVERNFTN